MAGTGEETSAVTGGRGAHTGRPESVARAPVAAAPEALVVSGGWQIEGLPATVRRALCSIAVTVPADAGAALLAARPSDSPAWSGRWCPLVTSPASLPSPALSAGQHPSVVPKRAGRVTRRAATPRRTSKPWTRPALEGDTGD